MNKTYSMGDANKKYRITMLWDEEKSRARKNQYGFGKVNSDGHFVWETTSDAIAEVAEEDDEAEVKHIGYEF